MATKKKSTDDHNDSSEDARHAFGISIQELETLMRTRGHEGVKELNETYGGLNGIGRKLKTNLINGLSGDNNDLSARIAVFGRNKIPPKPPRTILRLVLDALLDVRFVRPIIFAGILFALSFYYPSGDTFEPEGKPKTLMATKKKPTDDHNDSSSEHARREFGIFVQELETLMGTRGREGIKEFNETYGGLNGIEQKLKTNLINGLSGDNNDLSARIAAFGRNKIPPKPPRTILRLVLDALLDVRFVRPIIFAGILFALSFYYPSGDTFEPEGKPTEANVAWIECIIIIIAISIAVLVTAFNDWTKERQFRELQSIIELDQKFNVIRESQVHQIPIKDIVVGDICQIKYGDLLPVDGVVVQSNDLKVDESSLTGEIDLIKKDESEDPFLLSGTHIMEGNGKMLVLAVGEHSQMGIINKLLGAPKEENNDNNKQNTTTDADVGKRQVKLESTTADAAVNNQDTTKLQEIIPDNTNQANNDDDPDHFKFEERPSLQAKLTELANQITYAGKN
ncbi:unnamed protein product [Rotaria sordida]|uniref:Cation-transporting P-type ATPase N-terminal domain-containing protein n=1 Tax=Rotaria sordida TaxID=392033 RepID=A0A815KSH4_9BILA|nr:unnamed protein product [Rotaria sordida]